MTPDGRPPQRPTRPSPPARQQQTRTLAVSAGLVMVVMLVVAIVVERRGDGGQVDTVSPIGTTSTVAATP
ncbi:MAG: hypothetical protein ACKOAT_12755, partial [Actinomycetota bacterium]